MASTKIRTFLTAAAIFAGYFITAKIGLNIDAISGFATLVWPPSGIALASLLLFGFRFWPAIFLAAFFVNLDTGAPLFSALGIGLGNTLEAVAAAYVLKKFTEFRIELSRTKDVAALVIVGAIFSTTIGASVGVLSLWLGNVKSEGLFLTWAAWWTGDALGDLIIAPLILVCATWRWAKPSTRRVVEAIVLTLLLEKMNIILFSPYCVELGLRNATLAYLLFPFIIWAALRFDQMGSVLAVFSIALAAIWGTQRHYGPFSHGELRENLFLLQSFISIVSLTALVMAASVTERKRAILERKLAEENLRKSHANLERLVEERSVELRKSEERLRLMIQGVKDYAIFMLDRDGCVSTWNDGAERIKGYKMSEVIGQHFSKFYLEADRDSQKPKRALAIALSEGRYIEEGWRLRKDGSKFWAVVTITCVRDKDDNVLGFSKVVRDLTEQKRFEQTLREANANFLSVASHELRTPLTSLYLQLQMIERMFKSKSDSAKMADKVVSSIAQAKQLGELIDVLLDVSRLESDNLVVEREVTSLTALAKETVNSFAEQANEAGSELVLDVSGEIFACVDRLRVSQAMANLISNAIKYGDGQPIEVGVSAANETARISVRDHGQGIDRKDQARIFERFERAVSHHNISGMGLGLFIAKEVAQAHGGRIRLMSEVKRGSTFILELPL